MLWYGFPVPNVTDPSLPTSGVSQAPPEPRPRARTPFARVEDRVELPQQVAVGGIERHQHAAAGTRPVGAGQVNPPVGHLRLDLERPLAACSASGCPPRSSCRSPR